MRDLKHLKLTKPRRSKPTPVAKYFLNLNSACQYSIHRLHVAWFCGVCMFVFGFWHSSFISWYGRFGGTFCPYVSFSDLILKIHCRVNWHLIRHHWTWRQNFQLEHRYLPAVMKKNLVLECDLISCSSCYTRIVRSVSVSHAPTPVLWVLNSRIHCRPWTPLEHLPSQPFKPLLSKVFSSKFCVHSESCHIDSQILKVSVAYYFHAVWILF